LELKNVQTKRELDLVERIDLLLSDRISILYMFGDTDWMQGVRKFENNNKTKPRYFLKSVPNADHQTMIDNPQCCMKYIREFFLYSQHEA